MKQALILVGVALLILLGARYYFDILFDRDQSEELVIKSISGSAEIQMGEGGAVRPAQVSEKLVKGAEIRTQAGSEVVIGLQAEDQIVLAAESKLAITELSQDRTAFELQYGSLNASVTQYRNRSVEFTAPGNPVRIKTAEGAFTMVHDGFGTYDLRSTAGDVQLVEADGIRSLEMGERVVVDPDGIYDMPTDAKAKQLLLKVDWPTTASIGESVKVSGRTELGTALTVEGQRLKVGKDGQFEGEIPLPTGRIIHLAARNSGGSVETKSPEIKDPTPIPKTEPPPKPATGPQLNVRHNGVWD